MSRQHRVYSYIHICMHMYFHSRRGNRTLRGCIIIYATSLIISVPREWKFYPPALLSPSSPRERELLCIINHRSYLKRWLSAPGLCLELIFKLRFLTRNRLEREREGWEGRETRRTGIISKKSAFDALRTCAKKEFLYLTIVKEKRTINKLCISSCTYSIDWTRQVPNSIFE